MKTLKTCMMENAYPYDIGIMYCASHYCNTIHLPVKAQAKLRKCIDSCLNGRYKAASVYMRQAAAEL